MKMSVNLKNRIISAILMISLFGIFFTMACFAGGTQLVWEEIDFIQWKNELSLASSEDGFVYATGGKETNSSGGADNNLWIYDATQQTSSAGAPMNQARRQHGSVFLDGYLYVMGGKIGWAEETVLDSVERYNPGTDSWETMPSLLVPRAGAAVCVYEGKIWVFGGHSLGQAHDWDRSSATDSSEIFDPATGQWSFGPSLPKLLDRVFAAVVGDSIWLVGKYGSDKYFLEYRPSKGTWHIFRYHLGDGEMFSGITAMGDTILILSSIYIYSSNNLLCWIFTPGTHSLQRTTGPPIGGYGMSGVTVCGNAFYVVGGTETASQKAVFPPVESASATLSFVHSPSNARPEEVFAQQPVVEVLDANGNRAGTATGQITVSIVEDTGKKSAVLMGTTTVPIADGLSSFTDLAVDLPGSRYQLNAESNGIEGAVSQAFEIRELETGAPVRLNNAVNPINETEPVWEHYPAVATNGNDYLAVWYRNYYLTENLIDVETFFSRVLPNGTVMEPSGIELDYGGYLSAVCWTGEEYWVVQNKYRIHDERIIGVRITSDGEILDDVPFKLGSAGHDSGASIMPPALAINGDRLLVVWEKVDPQGIYGSIFCRTGN